MDLSIQVCDVCKQLDRETVRYSIQRGDVSADVDLCRVHGKPLEALLAPVQAEVKPMPTPARTRRSRGRVERQVKTLDEIERLKR